VRRIRPPIASIALRQQARQAFEHAIDPLGSRCILAEAKPPRERDREHFQNTRFARARIRIRPGVRGSTLRDRQETSAKHCQATTSTTGTTRSPRTTATVPHRRGVAGARSTVDNDRMRPRSIVAARPFALGIRAAHTLCTRAPKHCQIRHVIGHERV